MVIQYMESTLNTLAVAMSGKSWASFMVEISTFVKISFKKFEYVSKTVYLVSVPGNS